MANLSKPMNMNQQQTPASNEGKKMPLKSIRVGSVKCTVWENNGENGNYCTVSIERSYKDKAGAWQTTNSYAANDLANLLVATTAAQRFILIDYPEFNKQGE